MDKKCIPHSHATLCVLLCLATLLCFTSCFNLSSTQRGNFSFTINEAVAQQLENALGPRVARSASGPVITATVTLTQTAGGQLAEPAIKSGTLTSLRNETFTFEGLPLSVPFTVSVSFTADEKELFSGTSEPITLTSEDTTQVAIALHHLLDTDIVVPYWYYDEDDYYLSGAYRYADTASIPSDPSADFANYSGADSFCFDAYGNVWSVATNSYYAFNLGDVLYFNGTESLPSGFFYSETQDEAFSIALSSGYIRSVIPDPYAVSCDYSKNELYIVYEYDDAANVLILPVDEILSLNPAEKLLIPSDLSEEFYDTYSLPGIEWLKTDPLLTNDEDLYTILGYEIENENGHQYAYIKSFTVYKGIMYVIFSVVDRCDDGVDNEGWYLAAIDTATKQKTCEKKINPDAIFDAGTNINDVYVTDMLYQDGKLYVLVSYKSTTGALVRIDPATLTFSSSDVLGVSSDIKTVPGTQRTGGWWMYKSGSEVFDAHELYYEDSSTSPRCETGPAYNSLISNDSNGFLGPVKFVAIKPKKLIVADYGFYYEEELPKSRLLTIDLTNFSIEASETKDLSFDIANRSDVESAVSISYPFEEGQLLWYGGTDKQSITFTESMVAEYSGNSDLIPVGKMYYY